MKIKYISNFTDGTDWAMCANYNVLALVNAGYDIYCEEIKYNNSNVVIDDEILNLINKKTENYDITIHHVLPHHYLKRRNTYNIGFYPFDISISDIVWKKKISLMDSMLVPNYNSKLLLENMNLNIPVKIFHSTLDYEKIKNYKNNDKIAQMENACNFVFINDFSKHKNLEDCLRAYHTEFDYVEPVNLIIASNKELDAIRSFTQEVKNRLKKPNKYKDELIFSGEINQDNRLNILSKAQALVIPSYAESNSYVAMEAMCLGIPVLYTDGLGISSHMEYGMHFPIKSELENCYGEVHSMPGLYSCEDSWLKINITDLKKSMRNLANMFFRDNKRYNDNKVRISNYMQKFDYRNKNLLKDVL